MEYVKKQAVRVTPAAVKGLLLKLPLLKVEFTQIAAPAFPHLFEQLEFLAGLVEDFAEGVDEQIPYVVAAEAAFVLLYVHKHIDMISGELPSDAHADDSSIVRAVLTSRQAELADYASRHQIPWQGLTPKP
ncbi:hypothetical protein [Verrucomicrobium sp. GAS474]|uniref:hypothetical protein n=1 Tax=Verrucomicrobium sp. GAS474 TaxID=1882831 RepID=UPI0012FF6E6E|nr:hypothetical protein [Verrucomicrobium sp. GAS474]